MESIDTLLPLIQELIRQQAEADRREIALYDAEDMTSKFGDYISGRIRDRVFQTGKTVVSQNALMDPAFRLENNEPSKSIARENIGPVVCVPLKSQGVPFGVIYVDKKTQQKKLFQIQLLPIWDQSRDYFLLH